MKRILAVSTSPRKGGNADTMVHAAAKAARTAGAEVWEVTFRDKDINYCISCGYCKAPGNAGLCSQKDDMPEIIEYLKTCDGVIFSTGVYFGTITAQAKTFIDRMYTLFVPGPPPKDKPAPEKSKKVLFIMTQGMPRPEDDKARAEYMAGAFGLAGCTEHDYIVVDGCRELNSAANNPGHLEQAAKKGAWVAQ